MTTEVAAVDATGAGPSRRERRRAALSGRSFTIGLAAIGLAFRRRRRFLWPLASSVMTVAVVSALMYGNQRFRLVAEPAIIVFAAVAIVWLLARARPGFWDAAAHDVDARAPAGEPAPEPAA